MQNEFDLFKYGYLQKGTNLEDNFEVRIDSREIAELTGKRHDHILRDIKLMLSKLEGIPNFEDTYINEQNKQKYRCYKLPKRETLILVSGYSVELRAKIIDRLEYLERQLKPALPNSFAEALKLAYEQQLVIEQKEAQLKLQAPKVEYCDNVLDSKSCFTVTQIASGLGLTAQKLNKILCEQKIQYKQSGQYFLYSKYKGLGYTGVRTVPYFNSKKEKETKHETVWTEKGREFITGEIIKWITL